MHRRAAFVSLALLACAGAPAPAPTLVPATHADLVALYREFREFRVPEVRDGVPDYTAAAMRAKALKPRMASAPRL